VPIDDTTHWRYEVYFQTDEPLNKATVGNHWEDRTPDYRLTRNRANRYLQDREEMRRGTFSGLGYATAPSDVCVVEGAGRIQDRTQEHTAYADQGIIAARVSLLRAIREVQAGRDPRHVIRDPAANAFPNLVVTSGMITDEVEWRSFWKVPAPSTLV
jgi:phthalate 4,5-dioxygenase